MKTKNIISAVCLALILITAFLLRSNTFWLPHWTGDQSQYLSLAMKLEKFGLEHYNLRGINIKYLTPGDGSKVSLIFPSPADDIESRGVILGALYSAGGAYYDQRLFHLPPAFPYVLTVSHSIFSNSSKPYIVVETNLGQFLSTVKPKIFFQVQFYAVIIPLVFSLGLIILTYLLGRLMFSEIIGIYAAAMMAINPVTIFTSQKLWADDMLAFFIALSLFLFVLAYKHDKLALAALSGICCGVAILTKQTAGFYMFAVFAFAVITSDNWITILTGTLIAIIFSQKNPLVFVLQDPIYLVLPAVLIYLRLSNNKDKPLIPPLNTLLDIKVLLFIIGAILVSSFWFFRVYKTYGDPIYLPIRSVSDTLLPTKDISGWSKILSQRPTGTILYSIGIAILFPLFSLAFVSLKDFFKNTISCILGKSYDYRFILLWLVIMMFYYNLLRNSEERLMLPTYPAIAILSAYYLDIITARLIKVNHYRYAMVLLILVLVGLLRAPIGITAALDNKTLLPALF